MSSPWDNDPVVGAPAPSAAPPPWVSDPVVEAPKAAAPAQASGSSGNLVPGAVSAGAPSDVGVTPATARPLSATDQAGFDAFLRARSAGPVRIAAATAPNALGTAIDLTADRLAEGGARGLPFTDRAAAWWDTYLAPILGRADPGTVPGHYDSNLAAVRSQNQQFNNAHPFESAVGSFGANAALPLGALSKVAQAGTVGGRIFGGSLLGAGIGGLQGASNTQDLTNLSDTARNTAQGMALGGIVGGAVPALGAGAGAAYRGLTSGGTRVPGLSQTAQDYLTRRMEPQGGIAAVGQQAEALGPHGMLVDTGPSMLGAGQGTVLQQGAPQTIMTDALRARAAATNQRVQADVADALGTSGTAQSETNILAGQRKIEHQVLPQVFADAPPVDTSGVLATIGNGLNKAVGPEAAVLQRARSYLMDEGPNGAVPVTDAERLQNAKSAIDTLIDRGDPSLGVAPGAVSKAQGAIAGVRGQLNQTLRDQVPGYAPAMDASSELARRMGAIQQGTMAMRGGTQAIHPDDFAPMFASMSPAEQEAYRTGMRATVDRAMGTRANDYQAIKTLLQGPDGWAGANIGTAFGPEAQAALNNTVAREGTFANSANKIVENSQTAQRDAAKAELQQAPERKDLIQGDMKHANVFGTLVMNPARHGINAVANMLRPQVDNTQRDIDLARALTAQGEDRTQMMARLLAASQNTRDNMATSAAVARAAQIAAALAPNAVLDYQRRMR